MELTKTIAICCQPNVNFKFHTKYDAVITERLEGSHPHSQSYIHTYIHTSTYIHAKIMHI